MTGSNRRSGASSPANVGSYPGLGGYAGEHSYFYSGTSARPLPHREPSAGNTNLGGSDMLRADSITRYEETAFHRNELEAVKRENEALKRRIRELERTLRVRRQSDASVVGAAGDGTRSESVSTTASMRDRDQGGVSLVGAGRGRGRESLDRERGAEREKEDEESVQVGESARSAGVGR